MANYTKWGEPKLKAELVSRGFEEAELADLSKEQLIAQLVEDDAGGVNQAGPAPETEPEIDGDAPVSKGSKAKTSVFAILKGEKLIRTYSVEKHGKDVADLVTTFLSKDPGYTSVDASTISRIEVRWRAFDTEKKAYAEKIQSFKDCDQAIAFSNQMSGSVCVVS